MRHDYRDDSATGGRVCHGGRARGDEGLSFVVFRREAQAESKSRQEQSTVNARRAIKKNKWKKINREWKGPKACKGGEYYRVADWYDGV